MSMLSTRVQIRATNGEACSVRIGGMRWWWRKGGSVELGLGTAQTLMSTYPNIFEPVNAEYFESLVNMGQPEEEEEEEEVVEEEEEEELEGE